MINVNDTINTVISKADKPVIKTKQEQDAELKKSCAAFEGMFLEMMMKTMRNASIEATFIKKSNGEKIFTELLDQQYVDSISAAGFSGLGEALYKHLKDLESFEKPMGNNGSYEAILKNEKEKSQTDVISDSRLDLIK